MESRTKIIVIVGISSAILIGFICCMIAVFYTGLDTTPVLEYRPLPREENAGSTLIWYTTGNYKDIWHWVDSLNEFIKNEFIKPYEGRGFEQETSDVKDCSESNRAITENGEVCKFDYQYLGMHCTAAESWGYSRRSPCVILKMNKVIGWVPDVYNKTDIDKNLLPENMPEDLKELIKQSARDNGGEPPQMVWVSCNGANAADQEYIGTIEFTPWQGFPAYYFPYMNIPGYLSPIVALRFLEPASNVLIHIQCKAWAKNIMHSTEERSGLVQFELLRD